MLSTERYRDTYHSFDLRQRLPVKVAMFSQKISENRWLRAVARDVAPEIPGSQNSATKSWDHFKSPDPRLNRLRILTIFRCVE